MLKKLGNIFQSQLPPNTRTSTIPTNNISNIFGTFFNKIVTNYTRYEKNANIFRTFIKIDKDKATELNLSYFKTITINKIRNSKYAFQRNGYTSLLNENQKVNLKNFISNDTLNRNFDLIKKDILGREFNLNEIHNQFSVENFASRNAYNYNVGLTVDADLNISQYQDLFFELAYNADFKPIISSGPFFENITKYDLIIYAMNSNDEIIDVKKIENFNTAEIDWNVDQITQLYDIDEIDFDKLLNMTFDTSNFNNLRRKFYINTTQYCKQVKSDLTFYPIENISIQENSNEIEPQLNRINFENAFATTDKIELTCNTDLTLNTLPPVEITYKVFMKIASTNSYVIKNFRNTIIEAANLSLNSQLQKLRSSLQSSTVKYLTNFNAIKIDLRLQKTALTDVNFNPRFSSIFINNDDKKDYANQVFTAIPTSESIPNLNLQSNLLTEIMNNSISDSSSENIFTFYLKNYSSNPLNLKFIFEQDFEIYEINFDIEKVYEAVNYEQTLTLIDNGLRNKDFSNLNVSYSIKIRNFKNNNTNLNRFLSLNYENIFLQELQEGKSQLSQDFENNVFVIIKKSISQEGIHIKDKYYIFNKDLNFNNIQLQTENDLNLRLNFNDNLQVNNFFFKSERYYDNLDITKSVTYYFEARVMIIPIGFFIINSEYSTKKRIKELLSLNNFKKPLPSSLKIEEIFNILKRINDNQFNDLNQLFLHKLYDEFCLKETQASSEISISPSTNLNVNLNKLAFKNFNYLLVNKSKENQSLRFSINFDFLLRASNNESIIKILDKIKEVNLFNSFFFRNNNSYTDVARIPNLSSIFSVSELQKALNTNLEYQFTPNDSNSIEITVTLRVNSDLKRFFNAVSEISKTNFAPYTYDFLNENLYLKINIPARLTENNTTIEFFSNEDDFYYTRIDFERFLN